MKGSLLVFGLMLATAAASYWHDELKSVKSMYSVWSRGNQRSRIQKQNRIQQSRVQQTSYDCKTVVWNEQIASNGGQISLGWLHVCPTDSDGVCHTSTIRKCCNVFGNETDVTEKTVTVAGHTVEVKIVYVATTGNVIDVCAYYGEKYNDDIKTCPTAGTCFPVGCQNPPQFCTNNSAVACDFSGCQECKTGYAAPPRCCDCAEGYRKASDGSCKFVCSANCLDAACSSCAHPYTDAPFCCECVSPFVKQSDGTCACPQGQVEINGQCKTPCTQNSLSCGKFGCNCKTGFQPPLCCECIFDEQGSGDSYFESNGQCKKICKQNAESAFCSVESGCSQCEDSFAPPDCCECKDPLHLIDGVCRLCLEGEVAVDGKCKQICTNNIVANSCTETSCQCLSGYTGADCCDCASGYIINGQACRRCPPGQVPNSDQTACICDPANGKQIMVDGECKDVCESAALECTETGCSCKPLFAAPDCCKCSNGEDPVNGVCSIPCPDDQTIIFLMDRSTGISQFEIWGAMYAIELFISALLRGTRNLNIQVVSYADQNEGQSLLNLTPEYETGDEITPTLCTNALKDFELNIRKFTRPRSTFSGYSMEQLKSLVKSGTKTTVITFSGTISNQPSQNLLDIANGIKEIQQKVGAGYVRFFAAGFEAENIAQGDTERKQNYESEVKALGNNIDSHSISQSVGTNASGFMHDVTNMLYRNGVLCKAQSDALNAIGSGSATAISKLFLDYETCVTLNSYVPVSQFEPCIEKKEYDFICLSDKLDGSAVSREKNVKMSLLSAMKELLERLN